MIVGAQNVALCGLVKSFKLPTKSRDAEFFRIIVHIIDESSPITGIWCDIISNTSEDRLADVGSVGAIVLIKGLYKIQRDTTTKLRAVGNEHMLVGMFPEVESSNMRIGSWYELASDEKKRVEELRLWSKREGPLLLNTRLKEIAPGHYFNAVCQVATKAIIGEQGNALLSQCV